MKNWKKPEINCVNISDTESHLLGGGGDGVVYGIVELGENTVATIEGGTNSPCNTGSRVKLWDTSGCESPS